MKLGYQNDTISYVGDVPSSVIGDRSVYRVELEGRPVLDVHVLHADGRIEVSEPNGAPLVISMIRHSTNGIATFKDEAVEDADGNPVGMVHRVSGVSVYEYVLPRLHRLIARVWVS